MDKPLYFEFSSYNFNPHKKRVDFHYRFVFPDGNDQCFIETLTLPRAPRHSVVSAVMNEALTALHIALGISYYKLYAPKQVRSGVSLSKEQAAFWTTVYRKGLGEFFYTNKLDPKNSPVFPYKKAKKIKQYSLTQKNRVLLGIGGGKDSIVAYELLHKAGVSVGGYILEAEKENKVITDVVTIMKVHSLLVRRKLDPQIFMEEEGQYRGHIPISVIYACTGLLLAILYDYRYIAVANERSSNFGNHIYKGEEINHQWSKSEEFEKLFQRYVNRTITGDIIYFSPIRQYYEIRIARLFAEHNKYFSYFSSCNRNAAIHGGYMHKRWCGICPKCAFVFLLLAPFIRKKKLIALFGRNMLAEEALQSLYKNILGYGSMKPFDCVGTFDEARAALYLSQKAFGSSPIHSQFISRIKHPEALVTNVFAAYPTDVTPKEFSLLGKRIAILGFGIEGKTTLHFLKNHNFYKMAQIDILDKSNDSRYLTFLSDYDLVIKSPGVSAKLPEILKARANGIIFSSQTHLFFEHAKGTIIGITGSKGKSTTATLLYAMLSRCHKDVHLAGNIGTPMLSLVSKLTETSITILELSSFQLDSLPYSPHIAVVLDIFPDHLDWHGTIRAYLDAKAHITRNQKKEDMVFYLEGNENTKKIAMEGNAKKKIVRTAQKTYFTKKDLYVPAEHMFRNAVMAARVAEQLGCRREKIREVVQEFTGLPHRLQFVATKDGVTFYNDSLSTNPHAALAAAQTFSEPIILIMGGKDRGISYEGFARNVKKTSVRYIVLFGENKKKIAHALRHSSTVLVMADNLTEAVTLSGKKALEIRATMDACVVILSPGASSFDMFTDYRDRGDKFIQLVTSLKM